MACPNKAVLLPALQMDPGYAQLEVLEVANGRAVFEW
jgi:hypothetical protein